MELESIKGVVFSLYRTHKNLSIVIVRITKYIKRRIETWIVPKRLYKVAVFIVKIHRRVLSQVSFNTLTHSRVHTTQQVAGGQKINIF